MSPCKFSGRADPLGLQTYDWIGGSFRPPECTVPSDMLVLLREELCTPEYSTWNWFAPEYAASEVHSSLLQWHGHIFVDPRRDAQQHFESIAVSRGIATEVRWKANCNNLNRLTTKTWSRSRVASFVNDLRIVRNCLSWKKQVRASLLMWSFMDSSPSTCTPRFLTTTDGTTETPDTGKGFGCTRRSFPFEPIQMNSVLSSLSLSRLEAIHLSILSRHGGSRRWMFSESSTKQWM